MLNWLGVFYLVHPSRLVPQLYTSDSPQSGLVSVDRKIGNWRPVFASIKLAIYIRSHSESLLVVRNHVCVNPVLRLLVRTPYNTHPAMCVFSYFPEQLLEQHTSTPHNFSRAVIYVEHNPKPLTGVVNLLIKLHRRASLCYLVQKLFYIIKFKLFSVSNSSENTIGVN